MTRLSSQALMLGLIGLMAATFIATIGMAEQELILSGLAAATLILSLVLERFFPQDPDWNTSQNDTLGDVISLGLIMGALDPALKWGIPLFILWVIGDTSGLIGGWPLALQILAVTVVIELGAYISHRLHHSTSFLWRLHATHHSPERLYTLNNFRFHPLNHLLNGIVTLLPALAIGASPTAVLGYVALTYPIILMQHANVSFRFGWLNYVLNTNEVHRWHHSSTKDEGDRNFGRAFVIWDQLAGTFLLADGMPKKVGLFSANEKFPKARHFFTQISYPFSPNCCARP